MEKNTACVAEHQLFRFEGGASCIAGLRCACSRLPCVGQQQADGADDFMPAPGKAGKHVQRILPVTGFAQNVAVHGHHGIGSQNDVFPVQQGLGLAGKEAGCRMGLGKGRAPRIGIGQFSGAGRRLSPGGAGQLKGKAPFGEKLAPPRRSRCQHKPAVWGQGKKSGAWGVVFCHVTVCIYARLKARTGALCLVGGRDVTEHFAVLHVQHAEKAVLIKAVAAGRAAFGQREGAGIPEVQAVQGFSPGDVGVPAQNDRAGLQPGAGRIFRQVMPVAGENLAV